MGGMMGSGGTETTTYPDPNQPAGYGFQQSFFDQIAPMLMGAQMPSWGGSIDPGMSPTAQAALQLGQAYGSSPAPAMMGQVNGMLGNYFDAVNNPFASQTLGSMQQAPPMYFGQTGLGQSPPPTGG